MAFTINGRSLISLTLTWPLAGRWTADVRCVGAPGDPATVLSGAVTIDLDGVQYRGFVVRSSVYGNETLATVVAGSGGLNKELSEKFYRGTPTVRSIVTDLLRETGEALSAASDSATLSTQLPAYERARAPGGVALTRLLDVFGAYWRSQRDGSIKVVAAETWPVVAPPHVLVENDARLGYVAIGPLASADLEPGVTFLERRIHVIEHKLEDSKLRTRAQFIDESREQLERLRALLDRDSWHEKLYSGIVDKQNADGSLDVVLSKFGMTQLPIRYGLPGLKVEGIPQGAQVLAGFESGDPRAPYAALFRPVGSLKLGTLLITIAGPSAPVPGIVIAFNFYPPTTAGEAALAAQLAVIAASSSLLAAMPPGGLPLTTDTARVV